MRGHTGKDAVKTAPVKLTHYRVFRPFEQLRSNGRRYSHTQFKNKEGSHAC
jgi:hypothetical protein